MPGAEAVPHGEVVTVGMTERSSTIIGQVGTCEETTTHDYADPHGERGDCEGWMPVPPRLSQVTQLRIRRLEELVRWLNECVHYTNEQIAHDIEFEDENPELAQLYREICVLPQNHDE